MPRHRDARRPQGERIGGGDGASAVERLARRVVLSLASGSTKIDTVDCISWNFPDRWALCFVKAILGGGRMKSSVDPLKEARNSRDLARRARRTAEGLTLPADRAGRNRYADEVEKRAVELEQQADQGATQGSGPAPPPPVVTQQQQQTQQQEGTDSSTNSAERIAYDPAVMQNNFVMRCCGRLKYTLDGAASGGSI
jgi:hypothetical protein